MSASKSATFLKCQWAYDPSRELEPDGGSAAARYGSSFHEIIAWCLTYCMRTGEPDAGYPMIVAASAEKWRSKSAGHELAAHAWGSFVYLRSWLLGKNPWGVNMAPWSFKDASHRGKWRVESSYALKMNKPVSVRSVASPSIEGHRYDLEPGEIGATADLEIFDSVGLTLDHKTGSSKDFSSPAEDEQLRSLGLAHGETATPILAVGHFDRRGLPMIYAEEAGAGVLKKHAASLRKAMRRVGDGSLTPGPWCKTCPGRSICPSQFANLIPAAENVASQVLDAELVRIPRSSLTTADSVGRAHFFKAELGRLLDKLGDEIRVWVEAHPDDVATRPDGKSLEFVDRSYESLSKTSIVEALGKVEGERLIEKLRKMGVMKAGSRKELHAVAERG